MINISKTVATITPSKKACHLEKVFVSLFQPNFFKKFAALGSLSSQSAFDTNNGSLSTLPLPLALGCTVVLPAANKRIPAALRITLPCLNHYSSLGKPGRLPFRLAPCYPHLVSSNLLRLGDIMRPTLVIIEGLH
jgi:hypothetical protein